MQLQDEHGISHSSVAIVRKEIEACRLAVSSTKQFSCAKMISGDRPRDVHCNTQYGGSP